jgi:hypothetical protein
MPRRGRPHFPDVCYHVIGGGLGRRHTSAEEVDRQGFLIRFAEKLRRREAQCLAWPFMSTLNHFLIRMYSELPAPSMAPTLRGLAGRSNRRQGRCGQVFRNRIAQEGFTPSSRRHWSWSNRQKERRKSFAQPLSSKATDPSLDPRLRLSSARLTGLKA